MIILILFVVVLFLGFCGVLVVKADRKILRDMRGLIADYNNQDEEERRSRKTALVGRLITLKGKIYTGDKKALEEARDLLHSFE